MSLRKISVTLVVGLCLNFAYNSWAQDAYYQDKAGAVPLWYSSEKLVVKFTESGGSEMGSALASDPAFDLSRLPEQTMHGFYVAWLVQGTNVAAALERLDTNQYFEIANPIYLDAADTTGLVSFDRVSVKFLENVSRLTIDSLNAYWNVTVVDSITGILNFYVLKVSKNTGRSVLEIANIYEQDSHTEFAIPDFLANIQAEYVVNPICQDTFRLLFVCGFGSQILLDFCNPKPNGGSSGCNLLPTLLV